jgi:hypothetical protein
MNWQSDVINEALICDDYEFTTPNARGRYIGTDLAKRPQYLKDNPDKWRDIREIRKKIAERAQSASAIVKVDLDSSSSCSNASNSENVVAKAVVGPPRKTPNAMIPATGRPASVDPLLRTIVENAVTINGRAYITTEQFASMLDVSVRTFHRMFADGKRPGKIKLPGTFYELDEALKWTADRKREIKRHH